MCCGLSIGIPSETRRLSRNGVNNVFDNHTEPAIINTPQEGDTLGRADVLRALSTAGARSTGGVAAGAGANQRGRGSGISAHALPFRPFAGRQQDDHTAPRRP